MRELSKPTETTENIVNSNPLVYSTVKKEVKDEERLVGHKKKGVPQIVTDYQALLFRIAGNDRIQRPTRVSKLDELAKKFRTGFPQKNDPAFVLKWTPVLVASAESLSKQLIDVERAKTVRSDVGHVNGPDQKKISESTIKDAVAP